MRFRATLLTCLFAMLAASTVTAATYEVTVTNLTKRQTFTPILVVSHMPSIDLFQLGAPASTELATIAEAGTIGPMDALLGTLPQVRDTNTNGGLLGPGETTTIAVEAGGPFRVISFAGMLIPTNDTFVAARSIPLPLPSGVRQVYALAYDAGTEANDQNCANIPGPTCMGQGFSDPVDDDEGYVYVSNGIHEMGDMDGDGNTILSPASYDWRNPVAYVTVERVVSDHDDEDEGGDDERSD